MNLSMSSWGSDSMVLGLEVVGRGWCYQGTHKSRRDGKLSPEVRGSVTVVRCGTSRVQRVRTSSAKPPSAW
jgi:hypothetical protein